MPELYANANVLHIFFLTFVIGCGCAWQAGRSIALTWRPLVHALFAAALLGCAVRFLHFALFQETLFAPLAYAFETACLMIVAFLGWRYTRARQMVRQYYWIYEPNGPLGWRLRQDATSKGT